MLSRKHLSYHRLFGYQCQKLESDRGMKLQKDDLWFPRIYKQGSDDIFLKLSVVKHTYDQHIFSFRSIDSLVSLESYSL